MTETKDAESPALLPMKAAAAYLGTSYAFVYNLVSSGRLQAVRLSPRCVRIERSELERFVQGCRN